MEPNNTPQQPQQPNQNPAPPQQTQQSDQPQPGPAPMPQQAPQGSTPQRKSNKGLLIGLLVGAFLLIVGVTLIVLYFLLWSPAAQAKRASNAFMSAATSGDVEKLYEIDGTTDDSMKQFLANASENVRGDYTLVEQRFDDGTGYYIYSLTNEVNNYARTTVQKGDSGWGVVSFVFSPDQLSITPNESTEPAEAPQQVAEPTQPAACLTDADVAVIAPGGQAMGVDFEDYRSYVGQTYFFQPDSAEFAHNTAAGMIDEISSFYQTNSAKQFTFVLTGKVREGASTNVGVQLANQRVNTIKSALEQKGVPADRIVIEEPTRSAEYTDGSERNVDLKIHVPARCGGRNSTSNNL